MQFVVEFDVEQLLKLLHKERDLPVFTTELMRQEKIPPRTLVVPVHDLRCASGVSGALDIAGVPQHFGETVRNVLLTLFTMGLFLLTGYILYVLFNQLYDFILAVVQEVGLRG